MRILLTNDDGIHAPGLQLLERIAAEFSDDVYVVAPETDQSGVAHSLSLANPLRLREISPRHFAVQGTPTDCVIMARAPAAGRQAAGPRALRRQSRPERRRGRHLFRHDRGGDGGNAARRAVDRALAGLRRAARARERPHWDNAGRDRAAGAREDPASRHSRGHPAERQFPVLRGGRRPRASRLPRRGGGTPN